MPYRVRHRTISLSTPGNSLTHLLTANWLNGVCLPILWSPTGRSSVLANNSWLQNDNVSNLKMIKISHFLITTFLSISEVSFKNYKLFKHCFYVLEERDGENNAYYFQQIYKIYDLICRINIAWLSPYIYMNEDSRVLLPLKYIKFIFTDNYLFPNYNNFLTSISYHSVMYC